MLFISFCLLSTTLAKMNIESLKTISENMRASLACQSTHHCDELEVFPMNLLLLKKNNNSGGFDLGLRIVVEHVNNQ